MLNDPDSLTETEKAVLETLIQNPDTPTATIADEVGIDASLVRDIRTEYESEIEPCPETVPWADLSTEEATDDTFFEAMIDDETVSAVHDSRVVHKLMHLFTSIPDAVVETELEDEPIVRSANPAFEEIFGYDRDEIIGEPLEEFIIPESKDNAIELTEQTVDGVDSERIVARKTTTGTRDFLHRHVPYKWDGSQYAFEVYSDLTEQRRRKAELERKNKQLEQKREQFELFASILTHDLRNPISIAGGYLAQIKTPENEETVEIIERAHERVQDIIDDTLTLKKESESLDELEPVSIETAAHVAWELIETGDSELRVVDQFEIMSDSDRLRRLFENLFRNAIDHNEEPVILRVGIHNTMTTSTRGETQKAFYISDDGCGIPEDKREQVFEIGNTEARDGTGLGLAIVERIVDAHGWNIHVAESFDGGAKFIFTNVEIK